MVIVTPGSGEPPDVTVPVSVAVVGERWHIGSVLLEVSQPRLPCYKLGIRMNDARFLRRFTAANRPGAYLRIVEEGELSAGDFVAAEQRTRWGYDLLESMGEMGFLSTMAGVLAEALYQQGRYDEAEEQVRVATELGAPEDVETQRLAKGVQAKVLARRGAFEDAERLGREAVSLVDRSDSPSRAETLLFLAEVFSLAGRTEDGVVRAADERSRQSRKFGHRSLQGFSFREAGTLPFWRVLRELRRGKDQSEATRRARRCRRGD